jgi:pimeloyl-ACP methyl ester carboxylesterase
VTSRVLAALALLILGAATDADAQTTQPVDYSQDASWLCRPGRRDACAVDLTTTVVRADGRLTREEWKPATNPGIDCFYVYPTVSTDTTPFSDMVADEAERNVIRQQFARFGSVCRLFAPMYRQVTLAGLRTMIAGGGGGASLSTGPQYVDVERAWAHYLEHDNQGRGVVLVGHSQGSFILTELIRRHVDGRAPQSKLVSAILLGATLAVPKGKDVGGSFEKIRLCRVPGQTGCVVTYVSFRSTSPPPANTRFGRVAGADLEAACTNPAALAGGTADLHAYLDARGVMIAGAAAPRPWAAPDRAVETPWVSVPGLLSARCTTNEHASYLEITVRGDAADPRTDDIAGDLYAGGGQRLLDWGLHLVDANLAMGNLIEIVSRQARAWEGRRR